ncbi:MAG: DUF4249 domain-containing protein [Bacteriodetes bacterium]|nr:DUF4249 domain-containing protein [Bacteroidota bacterium]
MRNVLLIVVCCVLLLSCRETVVDFGTLPYIEKIVVDGMITSGLPLQITFSKTMPPLTDVVSKQPYDTAAFRLTNVDATIITNAGDTATMRHVRMGFYVAIKSNGDTLYVQPGITYNLKASWKGHNITATTTIPTLPSFETEYEYWTNYVYFDDKDSTLYYIASYNISAKLPYQVFGFAYTKSTPSILLTTQDVVNDTTTFSSIQFAVRNFMSSKNDGSKSYPLYGSRTLYATSTSHIDSMKKSDNTFMIVNLNDFPFYEYYTTRRSGSGSNGAFSSGGTNINWNINGDGIGLFCGRLIYIEKVVWKL